MLSTISGVVWDDLDGDGVRQAAEPGLPDRTVFLDANENGRLDAGEATTTTDAAGGYTFAGLPAGNYSVLLVLEPGWQQTLPAGIVRAEVVDELAEVLAPNDATFDCGCSFIFGPDGNLYFGTRRFDSTTGEFMGVYVQNRRSVRFFNGRGLTFDSQGNLYLYVVGEGIVRFQGPAGDQPGELIDFFSPSSRLLSPRDFSFGSDGNIYVSSNAHDTIERYNPTSGQYLGVFVASGAGGLDFPTGTAWGPDGNLYVASAETDEILRYDGATGRFSGALVTAGRGGLDYPVGIQFGPDGHLYVASAYTDEILRYDGSTGEFMGALVSRGSGGLDAPAAFAFGPDGALYVSSGSFSFKNDVVYYDVLRYDGISGKFTGAFAAVPNGRPYGLEFGPDGNLYAGRWSNPNGVLRFDGESGALIDEFIPSGFGGLTQTSFVHFGPDGLLYASGRDSGLHRYELIDRTWSFALGDEQHRENINFGNQQTGTGPVEDLTGNGFVDFEDLTVLLANWNQDVTAAAGNLVEPLTSVVNFEDLTVLLAAWTGPGGAASPPGEQAVRSDRIHAVDQDPMNRGLQQDPMNRVTTSAGVETSSAAENFQRRGKPAAYARHNPLRRLQAAAVDRALVEELPSTLARHTSAFVRRGR